MRVELSFNRVSLISVIAAVLAAGIGIAAPAAEEIALPQVVAEASNGQSSARVAPSVARVRIVEAADKFCCAEPDPESFDQAGLEAWWQHYQSRHPLRADASGN